MTDTRRLAVVDREPPPDDEPERPLAHVDYDAERAVLGAILRDPHALDHATLTVTAAHFYRPAHEQIYTAAVNLYSRSRPVDPTTVANQLGTSLTRAGGTAYLHQLAADALAVLDVTYYAQIVAHHAFLRRLNTVGQKIQQLATGTSSTVAPDFTDPHDLLAAAEAELAAIPRGVPGVDEDGHGQAVTTAVAELHASPGMPTPWSSLTDAIAGWKPACLYLIGARPGVGKSVAGVDIAMDTARRGKTALIYSLEMSRTEVYHRMLAAVGDINMAKIQHRNLAAGDWEHVTSAAEHITLLPLHVDDRAAMSLTQIHASVVTEQKSRDVGIVVIDYLQLITPPMAGKKDDRRVQVDSISRGLKALAKDCNLPVIALTQLNRGVESRADKTPTLADLREAGGQEQDADVVLLMHRDLTGKVDPPSVLKLGVAKNRHGAQATLELLFRGEFSRIEEPPWTPSSAGRHS